MLFVGLSSGIFCYSTGLMGKSGEFLKNEVLFVIYITRSIHDTPLFGSRYHYIHYRQQNKLSNSVNGCI